MARMRRRLEDQSAAALANVDKFRRPQYNTPTRKEFYGGRSPMEDKRGYASPRFGSSGFHPHSPWAEKHPVTNKLWQAAKDPRSGTSGFYGGRSPMEDKRGYASPRQGAIGNIYSTPEENENNRLSGMVNTLPAEIQMAKVYGIGDEGMINDPWYGRPRLSDEANAINQALDFARKPGVKAVQGISPSTLRGALGNELYKKNPEMYRNMLPGKILNKLPANAFETQDDWLNQQQIILNRGGAVGLEPGIASMMGYAKGGMVTKVRVPKGQSKWMKKFMNNMRDS